MMPLKKAVLLLVVSLLMSACQTNDTIHVKITNPADFDRLHEVVEIPLSVLHEKLMPKESLTYVVKNEQGEILPSQITSDEKLLFQAGLKANAVATFRITLSEPEEYKAITYARFVQERKDDFAWENDRVAFRLYGPALIEVDGPSNGIDLWYKRTSELVIDKWYRDDLAKIRSYHVDHGEGLDAYKVGRALGGGMMAPYLHDTLWLNENFETQTLLDNGPLRVTFRLTYPRLTVDSALYNESRTISLDAGSQLTKVVQEYDFYEETPVAAGISKRAGKDSYVSSYTGQGSATLLYSEPADEQIGNIYVGMVFPQGIDRTTIDSYNYLHPLTGREERHSHVLAVMDYQPDCPITYYTGYGWSKFGFPNGESFNDYLTHFALALEQPLVIQIN